MTRSTSIRGGLARLLLTIFAAFSFASFASCAGKPTDPVDLVRFHVQAVKSLAQGGEEPAVCKEKIQSYWAGAKPEIQQAVARIQAEAAVAAEGDVRDRFDARLESVFADFRDLGLILKEQGIQL